MKLTSRERYQNCKIISQHFDTGSEKKLQASLCDQIRVSEMELQKQRHFTAICLSQLSQIEVALDNQSASFESEFGASSIQIKRVQEEKNSLYAKEMALRKNIHTANGCNSERSLEASHGKNKWVNV